MPSAMAAGAQCIRSLCVMLGRHDVSGRQAGGRRAHQRCATPQSRTAALTCRSRVRTATEQRPRLASPDSASDSHNSNLLLFGFVPLQSHFSRVREPAFPPHTRSAVPFSLLVSAPTLCAEIRPPDAISRRLGALLRRCVSAVSTLLSLVGAGRGWGERLGQTTVQFAASCRMYYRSLKKTGQLEISNLSYGCGST